MSLTPRAARRILWMVLLATAPLPFYLGGLEFAPWLRLVFLSGLVWGIVLSEGTGGFQGLFALLAAVQVLLGAAILWGVAALAVRFLRGASGGTRAVVVGVAAVALLGLSTTDLYRTPLSSSRPQSNLFGMFE